MPTVDTIFHLQSVHSGLVPEHMTLSPTFSTSFLAVRVTGAFHHYVAKFKASRVLGLLRYLPVIDYGNPPSSFVGIMLVGKWCLKLSEIEECDASVFYFCLGNRFNHSFRFHTHNTDCKPSYIFLVVFLTLCSDPKGELSTDNFPRSIFI